MTIYNVPRARTASAPQRRVARHPFGSLAASIRPTRAQLLASSSQSRYARLWLEIETASLAGGDGAVAKLLLLAAEAETIGFRILVYEAKLGAAQPG